MSKALPSLRGLEVSYISSFRTCGPAVSILVETRAQASEIEHLLTEREIDYERSYQTGDDGSFIYGEIRCAPYELLQACLGESALRRLHQTGT